MVLIVVLIVVVVCESFTGDSVVLSIGVFCGEVDDDIDVCCCCRSSSMLGTLPETPCISSPVVVDNGFPDELIFDEDD